MAGSCGFQQMWGAAGWGWRSLRAKGQLKKRGNPPPALLFSGWAGAVLSSVGAQSCLPEGPLLRVYHSLGWRLSSSQSDLVRGVLICPRAGSLHHRSGFAQRDQRHFLGCCTFLQGAWRGRSPSILPVGNVGQSWGRTGFVPHRELQGPPPSGQWLQAGLQPRPLVGSAFSWGN